MSKVTQGEEKKATELGLGLEDLIRRGARELIQKAIETESGELLSRYGNVSRSTYVVIWFGLYLRDPTLQKLFQVREEEQQP